MTSSFANLSLLAFYEIARRANLLDNPELLRSPSFQNARELYEAREKYMWEAFGDQVAIDDYFKLRPEGALAKQDKRWEDIWAEFAPDSLKAYPLAPVIL